MLDAGTRVIAELLGAASDLGFQVGGQLFQHSGLSVGVPGDLVVLFRHLGNPLDPAGDVLAGCALFPHGVGDVVDCTGGTVALVANGVEHGT